MEERLKSIEELLETLALNMATGFQAIEKRFNSIEGELKEIRVAISKLDRRTDALAKRIKVGEKQLTWQYDRIRDHEERIFSLEESSI